MYRVMIIDDDEGIRDSLGNLLQKEGYEVLLAVNGTQAMDLFFNDADGIDMVLLDLNMPSKNGWTTFNELFQLNPALPVFVLTGLPHQREWAETMGADALIEKPIDVPELLRLMRLTLTAPVPDGLAFPVNAFRHVRAVDRITTKLHLRRNVASYNHWGLNE